MTDTMMAAVVVTNVVLGLMTLGVVVACLAGGCSAYIKSRKEKAGQGAHATGELLTHGS
jgi:hypothetical protein